jgi:hypothetical protein
LQAAVADVLVAQAKPTTRLLVAKAVALRGNPEQAPHSLERAVAAARKLQAVMEAHHGVAANQEQQVLSEQAATAVSLQPQQVAAAVAAITAVVAVAVTTAVLAPTAAVAVVAVLASTQQVVLAHKVFRLVMGKLSLPTPQVLHPLQLPITVHIALVIKSTLQQPMVLQPTPGLVLMVLHPTYKTQRFQMPLQLPQVHTLLPMTLVAVFPQQQLP